MSDTNVCCACRFSKDRFRDSCYCVQYGMIIGYGKKTCKGYKPMTRKDMEAQKHEQTNNHR